MLPGNAINDTPDVAISDAEFSGQCNWRFSGCVTLSNCCRLLGSEFCLGVSFAKRAALFLCHVFQVVITGAQEQMLNVYANRVVAFMADKKIVFDWSVCQFPCNAMRANDPTRFVGADTYSPVAFGCPAADPRNAPIGKHRPHVGRKPHLERRLVLVKAGTSAGAIRPLSCLKPALGATKMDAAMKAVNLYGGTWGAAFGRFDFNHRGLPCSSCGQGKRQVALSFLPASFYPARKNKQRPFDPPAYKPGKSVNDAQIAIAP